MHCHSSYSQSQDSQRRSRYTPTCTHACPASADDNSTEPCLHPALGVLCSPGTSQGSGSILLLCHPLPTELFTHIHLNPAGAAMNQLLYYQLLSRRALQPTALNYALRLLPTSTPITTVVTASAAAAAPAIAICILGPSSPLQPACWMKTARAGGSGRGREGF